MRVSLLAAIFAAAAVQAASVPVAQPRAFTVHMPPSARRAAPEIEDRAEIAAQAASHAHARRSGAHNLPRRRLVRRKANNKRGKKCTPKTQVPWTGEGESSATTRDDWSSSNGGSSTSSGGSSTSNGQSSTSHESTSTWSSDGHAPTDGAGQGGSDHNGTAEDPDAIAPPTNPDAINSALMPLGAGIAGWTTGDGGGSNHLSYDDALLPLQKGKLPEVTTAPDGSNCHVNKYPAGVVGGKGGFMFYTQGDKNGVHVESATEILMSYAVWFADGFDWKEGGKLPGVFGGTDASTAASCSGGRQDDACFSIRPMWRAGGKGELYDYTGPASRAVNNWCDRPNYVCNGEYGDSIERGAFSFTSGSWNTIAIRVRKNDPGQTNGAHELFINGESVIMVDNISFSTESVNLYGLMGQTFFGGSDVAKYAPTSDQTAYFKDWTLVVMQ